MRRRRISARKNKPTSPNTSPARASLPSTPPPKRRPAPARRRNSTVRGPRPRSVGATTPAVLWMRKQPDSPPPMWRTLNSSGHSPTPTPCAPVPSRPSPWARFSSAARPARCMRSTWQAVASAGRIRLRRKYARASCWRTPQAKTAFPRHFLATFWRDCTLSTP